MTLLRAFRIALFAALVLALPVQGLSASAPVGDDDGELDVNYLLIGHTADGFYLDFLPFGTVELPRIFVTDGPDGWGVDAFWSTKAALYSERYTAVLHHDDHAEGTAHHDVLEEGTEAEGPGTNPALIDEALTEGQEAELHAEALSTSDLEAMIQAKDHMHADIVPMAAGTEVVMDLSITRHYLFGLIAALICLLLFIPLARRYKKGVGRTSAPKGTFHNMMETMVVFVRDEIAKPNIGHKYARFLPFLLTAFFFVLFANVLGLVPYAGAATSNLAVTGILAFFTFILGQIYASKDHWLHIFWPPGVPVMVKVILIPVEFLGLFTKHIALAIRLFANMAAGSLIILSLLGLIFIIESLFGGAVAAGVAPFSVLLTLFISVVKLLVAFIQAYVFTMLSALFIGMAVEEHHHDAHDDPSAHAVEGPTPHGLEHDPAHVTPHPLGGERVGDGQRAAQPAPATA